MIEYFDGFGFYTLDGHSVFPDQRKPTMEIGCHLKLGPSCLHTHPLHLMAIICSNECDQILNELFDDIKVLEYVTPGKKTAESITYHKNIIIKNHGLFVSRDNLFDCLQQSLEIDEKCRQYLQKRQSKAKFLFPDALILEEENTLYHSYVQNLIINANLTQKELSEQMLVELENMEEEKYRKSLQ